MSLIISPSNLRQRIAATRRILPWVLAIVVVTYETHEHILVASDPVDANFYAELGIFAVLGPALLALALAFFERNLAAREVAEAEVHRLNATLEQQVAERTRTLEDAYRELEHKNRELQTLDQLKSEFVSLVSHELRAPLTNIRGGIELLLSDSGLSPHCRQTLEILGEQSRRLSHLVESTLEVSIIEARRWPLTPGPVAIPPLIRAIAREMLPCAGGCTIDWQIDDDLPFAWADENSVVQVLTNLLDNAVKFSPEGSTIMVTGEAKGDSVHVAVCDDGPGVPVEARERVFEKFHRLEGRDDRRAYGFGLGLYVARRLVEAQQGRIWVESDGENGARFMFSLPRATEGSP